MKEVFPERMGELDVKELKQSLDTIDRYIRYMSERIEILNREVNKIKEKVGM